MTDRYVGPGGSDGASGLTWALRKETLNGVEDTPVVAGDTIYVGPGIYRENFIIDVNGSNGSPITYIADVIGEYTDGVGGIVRVTGLTSEDSYPATRATCLTIVTKSYRTFRGLYFGEVTGGASTGMIDHDAGTTDNIIFDRCYFALSAASSSSSVYAYYLDATDDDVTGYIIKNCYFAPQGLYGIYAIGSPATSFDVENCIFTMAFAGAGLYNSGIGGMVVRGCSAINSYYGIRGNNLGGGEQLYIYDSWFYGQNQGTLDGGDDTTENYNYYDTTGASYKEGGDSIVSRSPHSYPILVAGYKLSWDYNKPTGYNANHYASSTGVLTTDIYGLPRPGGSKFTRGAIQYRESNRDDSEYRTAPSSIRLDDASQNIISVPINGQKKITVTAYVKREADYVGANPQVTVRLPTQGAATVTDIKGSGAYNRLSVSVNPASGDKWIQIELTSSNTATSGNYKVWFDDIKIKTPLSMISTMKWVTNEIPLFYFVLDKVVDPWILPTVPIPGIQAPVKASVNPVPSFYRS